MPSRVNLAYCSYPLRSVDPLILWDQRSNNRPTPSLKYQSNTFSILIKVENDPPMLRPGSPFNPNSYTSVVDSMMQTLSPLTYHTFKGVISEFANFHS